MTHSTHNRQPIFSKRALVVGALLILFAMLVSSDSLIAFLQPGQSSATLLLGATIFRLCLGVVGVAIIALSIFPIWVTRADDVPLQAEAAPTPASILGMRAQAATVNEKRFALALGILLLVALALRLYALNAGLWLDEIITNVLYARLPFGAIVTTFDSENQHFLYSLMAHASFLLFGDNAWALRLPAVLFGVGSIWAMYLFAREVASPKEGLLAAALLTFSYTHIWFSQNARGYSGLLFWSILSSWLLLRAMRETRPTLWLFYALTAALGVYTHITMVFVIVGQFVVYVWTLVARRNGLWENRWAGFFLGFIGAGLLTVMLHALVLPQLLGGMGREPSVVAEWKNPIWTIIEIAREMQLSFTGGFVAVGALVVFGAGLFSFARKRIDVILLLIVPPIVGASIVLALGHHLWPRFFFFAMGFAALVAIRGAMVWGEFAAKLIRLRAPLSAYSGIAVAVALVLASAISVPMVYGPKQDYAGAMAFVDANKQPGDAVVISGLTVFPYKDFYRRDWDVVESATALDEIRANAKRTWMIYTFPPVLDSVYPDVMASVNRNFQTIKEFGGTVGGGAIIVARSDSLGQVSK